LPGDRLATFEFSDNTCLHGGYRGCPGGDCLGGNPDDRDLLLYETVLSGDLNGDDAPEFANIADNSQHIITFTITSAPTLDGVTIRGGFAAGSASDLNSGGAGIFCRAANPVTISITNCIFADNYANRGGGGMFCIGCADVDFTVTDCTFRNNHANGTMGGGLCFCGGFLDRCVFEDNVAAMGGGGMRATGRDCVLLDCSFVDNSVTNGNGGGLSFDGYSNAHTLTARACTFLGNNASMYDRNARGGAAALTTSVGSRLVDCTFENNWTGPTGQVSTQSAGGGVYATETLFDDCSFSGNSSIGLGGAVAGYHNIAANCSFTTNSAVMAGGAVYGQNVLSDCLILGNSAAPGLGGGIASADAYGCTFVGNSAAQYGGGASGGRCVNCVLWNNSPDQVSSSTGVTYSSVEGGCAGAGNIADDPLFVDHDGPDDDPNTWNDNDYHLTSGSPCIDAGDSTAVPRDTRDIDQDGCTSDRIPFDRDRNYRFHDDAGTLDTGVSTHWHPYVDMGAYEYGSTSTMPEGPCFGDLNCDTVADIFDIDAFVLVLADSAEYSQQFPDCEAINADCDEDGIADIFDIDAFVALIVGSGS
ncbi:MAG: hypothetical protein JXO22_03455, partial [Phycisphaerae bacterium]|nr:hypothetical protein [Phycisphaerae bacterium]